MSARERLGCSIRKYDMAEMEIGLRADVAWNRWASHDD